MGFDFEKAQNEAYHQFEKLPKFKVDSAKLVFGCGMDGGILIAKTDRDIPDFLSKEEAIELAKFLKKVYLY